MELIIFFVSLFLSISMLAETLGVWARVLGAFNGEPATGYSTHVRIATLGRFFILLSAPTIGYLVDKGVPSNTIALIGFYTFIINFLVIIVFYKYGTSFFGIIYNFLNKRPISINEIYLDERMNYKNQIDNSFFLYVSISFLLTASGVIVVNLFATIYTEFRAMIVQMSAAITMFGTLLHVFLIDPKLSQAADGDEKRLIKYVSTFLVSRIFSNLLLSALFLLLFILL